MAHAATPEVVLQVMQIYIVLARAHTADVIGLEYSSPSPPATFRSAFRLHLADSIHASTIVGPVARTS